MLDHWLERRRWKSRSGRKCGLQRPSWYARGPSPVTGYPMQLPPAEQAEFEHHIPAYASLLLRADFGLPEVGWEDEVRRRHGLL